MAVAAMATCTGPTVGCANGGANLNSLVPAALHSPPSPTVRILSLGSRMEDDRSESSESRMEANRTTSHRWSKDLRTDMDERREVRLRSIARGDDAQSHDHVKEMNPFKAMYQLLQHVKFDPDGGILNLVNETTQDSKVPALRKSTLEICLALVAFMRCVLNPCAMIFCSSHMLTEYFMTAEGKSHFRQEMARITLNVPLEEAFICANSLEFVLAVGCILVTLYDCLLVLYYNICEGAKYTLLERASTVSYKYIYVSRLCLSDIPRLQSVSVLRFLQVAHPNLIAKHEKSLSLKDDLARPLLEGFLGVDAYTLNDDELSDEIAKVLINIECRDLPEDSKIRAARRYLDLSLSKALRELRAHRHTEAFKEHIAGPGLKPQALERVWRYDLLMLMETALFGSMVVSCFALGAIEFFHKICRCAFMLTEPNVPLGTAFVFFGLFLNQTMGMMSVNQLLRQRVETFIFGGADAAVSSEENYIMDAYMAFLNQKIWLNKDLSVVQKLALMFHFDDDDMQQLVVEESHSEKVRIAACVRSYMHKHGHENRFVTSLSTWVHI